MQIEQKIHEAIMNDKQVKELTNKIYQLSAGMTPCFNKDTNKIEYRMSDELRELYDYTEASLHHRIEQIKRFYDNENTLQGCIKARDFEKQFEQ